MTTVEMTDADAVPAPEAAGAGPEIGVAIVAFHSADVIDDCLESLFASQCVRLRVVVVDNHSGDDTLAVIRAFAARHSGRISFAEADVGSLARAEADLTLLASPVNGGFAYGVNRGVEILLPCADLDLFWVLNPDCEVPPETAATYVRHGKGGGFSLMGGRTLFIDRPELVQSDGGLVSRLTGVVDSINHSLPLATATLPDASALDFITGANCVAHRRFIERAGLMVEDYFVYYEEVDWAFRRGDLPLKFVAEAVVYHHGGTVIGTGSHSRRPSPFAAYFNYRNRIRFMRKFSPTMLPVAFAYGMAKAVQLVLLGAPHEARAVVTGLLGLDPPAAVAARLEPSARRIAFGRDIAITGDEA